MITIEQIIILAALVESIVLHEIAHGYVAYLFGDNTAKDAGRITLNPIPHIDPVMTIFVPAIMYLLSGFIIGGAKPVPVNPYNFTRRTLGDICVSLAGVVTNLCIAMAAVLLINIVILVSPNPDKSFTLEILKTVAGLNVFLAIFNLLPIPPLDGSHVVKYLIPREHRGGWEMIGRSGTGFLILIILINVPVFWRFMHAVLDEVFYVMNFLIFV